MIDGHLAIGRVLEDDLVRRRRLVASARLRRQLGIDADFGEWQRGQEDDEQDQEDGETKRPALAGSTGPPSTSYF
jgi:hypothetical protein